MLVKMQANPAVLADGLGGVLEQMAEHGRQPVMIGANRQVRAGALAIHACTRRFQGDQILEHRAQHDGRGGRCDRLVTL